MYIIHQQFFIMIILEYNMNMDTVIVETYDI